MVSALRLWLARMELRSPLDDEDRKLLTGLPFEILRVEANRDFVRINERTHHACLVADGMIGQFGQAASGDRQIASLHIPGDMVDLHSVVVPTATSALSALCASRIIRIPHENLRDLAERRPNIGRAFWRQCVVDAAVLRQSTLSIGRRDAATRLAHVVCELAIRYMLVGLGDRLTIPFPIPQHHLADHLGLTSVHVNRTLRRLREHGLLTVANRQAHIHDWTGLVAAGDFDPTYLSLPDATRHHVMQMLREASPTAVSFHAYQ